MTSSDLLTENLRLRRALVDACVQATLLSQECEAPKLQDGALDLSIKLRAALPPEPEYDAP